VNVRLAAIDPKRVFVDGTQVRFGTNNGQTITVTIPANSTRAAQTVKGVLQLDPKSETDKTDAWRFSVRSERGAKQIADLLKKLLNSCPKP